MKKNAKKFQMLRLILVLIFFIIQFNHSIFIVPLGDANKI